MKRHTMLQDNNAKVNLMVKKNKNVKDHNNKSGNNKRTWSYFQIMDEMFGNKPWVTSILTLDSLSSILSPASPTSSSSSNSSNSINNIKISSSPQSSCEGSRKHFFSF